MSNTNLPSATHETVANQYDMDGADLQDERVGGDAVDDEAVLDSSLAPLDDEDDDLIEDDDDDLLGDDEEEDLLDEEDDEDEVDDLLDDEDDDLL